MILKLHPEFAHDLVLGIPYAYWLHQRGELEKVVICKEGTNAPGIFSHIGPYLPD